MDHIKDNNFKKSDLRGAGFHKEVKNMELGLCPFCSNPVKVEDFRNEISRREFNISGICQKCQDDFFGKD
jgi:hypothetical protein